MKVRLRLRALYLLIICLYFLLISVQFQDMTGEIRCTDYSFATNSTNNINFVKSENNCSLYQLCFRNKTFDFSGRDKKGKDNKKIVLFYNLPEFMNTFLRKDLMYENCDYTNCMFSRNGSLILTADAVIFYIGIRNVRMGIYPPIHMNQRNPNQVWIFTSAEPPEHYYNTDYQLTSWHNTMNWSSLYRLDSDIPNPYGNLVRCTSKDKRDYDSIYNAKSKNALWIVSHCQVASERRHYVKEMIKHGFDVDIFGGCSSNGQRISQEELEVAIPAYKYFLAFENSFCNDYISEKYFEYYNMSWIILVRGGADYQRLLPEKTFINTADFKNVSALVQYLSKVANEKDTYTSFLRYKDRYISIRWPNNRNCEICRRLNNLSKFRKTYKNVADFVVKGQCKRPDDIKTIFR